MFANFEKLIETNEGCLQILRELKYPNGVLQCSNCGNDQLYEIKTRDLLQCSKCKKQFSLTSGTLFHNCRTDLWKVFRMLLDMASGNTKSVSKQAKELDLEESTDWRWRQKIRMCLEKEIPNDEVFKIDREFLDSVLFRRSTESPATGPNAKKVEVVEPDNVTHMEFNYSARSERERAAVSNVMRFISKTYHGVSEKYSQLYATESRMVERTLKFGFEPLLSALIRAGPIKCADIGKYSSPKIIDLPLPA